MKRSVKNLKEYTTETIHGEVGVVTEFYFDDETLTVRYLLVETGNWPFKRDALIPVEAFANFDWEKKHFSVNLMQEQILTSPKIDTAKPLSRQQENGLLNHYLGQNYWDTGNYSVGIWEPAGSAVVNGSGNKKSSTPASIRHQKDDIRLRSTQEVTGYHIYGIDGEAGVVEDFIVDDNTWKLHSIVVDTECWLPGKKVMIPPQCINEINWEHSKVFLNMSIIAIKNSPEYDPSRVAVAAGENPG